MKCSSTIIAASVLILGVSGTTPAATGSFNNKSAAITTAANRVNMGTVRYNTSSYDRAIHNPWRTGEVFQVRSTYNDRNKNPRQQDPVYRMETSYSRFECEIRTARAFDNKYTAKRAC